MDVEWKGGEIRYEISLVKVWRKWKSYLSIIRDLFTSSTKETLISSTSPKSIKWAVVIHPNQKPTTTNCPVTWPLGKIPICHLLPRNAHYFFDVLISFEDMDSFWFLSFYYFHTHIPRKEFDDSIRFLYLIKSETLFSLEGFKFPTRINLHLKVKWNLKNEIAWDLTDWSHTNELKPLRSVGADWVENMRLNFLWGTRESIIQKICFFIPLFLGMGEIYYLLSGIAGITSFYFIKCKSTQQREREREYKGTNEKEHPIFMEKVCSGGNLCLMSFLRHFIVIWLSLEVIWRYKEGSQVLIWLSPRESKWEEKA